MFEEETLEGMERKEVVEFRGSILSNVAFWAPFKRREVEARLQPPLAAIELAHQSCTLNKMRQAGWGESMLNKYSTFVRAVDGHVQRLRLNSC
jgi:hypothetical protein